MSKPPSKTAPANTVRARITPPTWPEVLRALGRTEARSYALTRFRDLGFSSGFYTDASHGGPARVALCRALVATKDWLELCHSRWPERESLRALRRRLEDSLETHLSRRLAA